MLTQGPQAVQSTLQPGGGVGGIRRDELQIDKEDVFPHLPFGWARFDPAHVETLGGEALQGLQQRAGAIGLQREGEAGQRTSPGAGTAAQQQKTGAVARHIIDRIGQHLQAMLSGGLARRNGSAEATAGHQPGRLGG